jgi:hypothetical protein
MTPAQALAQRRLNLKQANHVRLGRADLKRRPYAGKTPILKALSEPCAQSATLYSILQAQYRWGEAKTMKFFSHLANDCGVPIGTTWRIRDLSERQLRALREELR